MTRRQRWWRHSSGRGFDLPSGAIAHRPPLRGPKPARRKASAIALPGEPALPGCTLAWSRREALPPSALRAWRAVLPKRTLVFAVGGMRPDNLAPWWEAGADGFGTGSNLYRPGANAEAVREAARAYARGFAALPAR